MEGDDPTEASASAISHAPLSQRSGLALFRLWFPVAAVGAVAIAEIFWGLYLPRSGSLAAAPAVYGGLWLGYAAAESGFLFGEWRTRLAWACIGGAAGALAVKSASFPYWIAIGFLMSATCLRERRRSWVWMLVMPVLHGTMDLWANAVYGWASSVRDTVISVVPSAAVIPRRVFGVTAWLFPLTLTRALVGCFLTTPASKQSP